MFATNSIDFYQCQQNQMLIKLGIVRVNVTFKIPKLNSMKTATEIKECDHAEWIDKLKSYKHEIVTLEERLAEIARSTRKTDVLAQVEHFQNQFILQRSNLNDILYAIKLDEKEYHFELISMPKGAEHTLVSPSFELAEQFEKTMDELKETFTVFEKRHRAGSD